MNKKIIALIITIIVIAAGVGIWLISSNNNSNESNNANTNNLNSNVNMDENENEDNYTGNALANTEENATDRNNTEDRETSGHQKIAIIYFSATGTTKRVAGYIKDEIGGDLIEIQPKDKYTDEDLNYNNDNSRATKEQNDSSIRPEIENNIDTDSYDVIFLGYPIWWYVAPTIINTFLESYDFSGKTVIPFATSGSSGMGNTVSELKPSCSKETKWNEGKRFPASVSESELQEWTNKIDL